MFHAPNNKSREWSVGTKLVVLAIEFEIHLSADSIVKIDLTIYHVIPRGRVRICDVSNPYR